MLPGRTLRCLLGRQSRSGGRACEGGFPASAAGPGVVRRRQGHQAGAGQCRAEDGRGSTGLPGRLAGLGRGLRRVVAAICHRPHDRPLELGDEIKSISNEETFLKDTDGRKILRACLQEQAADIEARLKHRRLGAHTV